MKINKKVYGIKFVGDELLLETLVIAPKDSLTYLIFSMKVSAERFIKLSFRGNWKKSARVVEIDMSYNK